MDEELFEQTCQDREAYFRTLGEVEGVIWGPLVNPHFMGGPRWPSLRQGWRRIFRGENTILISEGLSDPFDVQSEPNLGFGLEVLLETSDPIDEQVPASWPFRVVYEVSQLCANNGQIREILDEITFVSTEFPAFHPALKEITDERERFGILLGIPSPTYPTIFKVPAGEVRVATIKLLTPTEFSLVMEKREEGRQQLAELFAQTGSHHLSSLTRASVV
jgi:hypothetical protein